MSINDKIKLYGLSVRFKPFQALDILSMFDIEAVTNSGGILADEMGFGKVLILLLFSYLLIHHRQSNASVNLFVIGGC